MVIGSKYVVDFRVLCSFDEITCTFYELIKSMVYSLPK